jgi:hypothetical protein
VTAAPTPDDPIHLRQLVAGGLPLLVAGVGETGSGKRLADALAARGLEPLEAFLGADLPRGARVGFVLDANELRLVDDRDDALMRTPRAGVDGAWLAAALRLRGTMVVVVSGLHVTGETAPKDVAEAVDAAARAGRTIGAIVGVAEERPSLPLLFG